MGYVKDIYGDRSKDFAQGFLAAMHVYATWRDRVQYIGDHPLKREMVYAARELGWEVDPQTLGIKGKRQ